MGRRASARVILGAFVLCGLVAGCMPSDPASDNDLATADRVRTVDGDPVIFTSPNPVNVDTFVAGRLRYDRGSRCLTIQLLWGPSKMREYVPIWPAGTTPLREGDRRGVRLAIGDRWAGDQVQGPDNEDAFGDDELSQRLRKRCPSAHGYIRFRTMLDSVPTDFRPSSDIDLER